MFNSENRRKMSNIVVDQRALLRLSIPFFVLLIISVGTIFAIHWQVISVIEKLDSDNSENFAAIALAQTAIRQVTVTGTIGFGLLGCACLALWIIYSHRIFGPTVAIRRHILELSKGNYSTRVNLRPGDEFKDVADDLNTLATALENKSRP